MQVLMGECLYRSHELTYGSELIRCKHCGRPVTGDQKTKTTKAGPKHYVYYRCVGYNAPGPTRGTACRRRELGHQVLVFFDRMKIRDEKVRDWFLKVLRARTREGQTQTEQRVAELTRQLTSLRNSRTGC